MNIYLPDEYLNKSCYVINNGYIRVYENNLKDYTDIYVNQDYMSKKGYSNTSYTGLCDNFSTFTSQYSYRVDFPLIFNLYFQFIFLFIFLFSWLYFGFFRGRK